MPLADGGARKFQAKRFNEHVKLLANFLNALSIATLGIAFVVPFAQGRHGMQTSEQWILMMVALILNMAGHSAIRLMRDEEG